MKRPLLSRALALLGCLALCVTAAAAAGEEPLGVCESLMQAMSDPPATSAETPLGDLTADAVRRMAETDMAVVPADEFAANLQPGEVFLDDVQSALPLERAYAVVSVTPQGLFALLEEACGRVRLTESGAIDRALSAYGGFLQVSGFTFRYDPNRPTGSRVREVAANGAALDADDNQTLYTLAVPETLAAAPYFSGDAAGAGFTAAGALAAYLRECGSAALPEDGRIHPIAVRDNDYINRFPVVLLAFAAIVVAVCAKGLRKTQRETRGQRF